MSTGLESLIDFTLCVHAGERLAYIHDEHFRGLAEPIRQHCKARGVACTAVEIAYDGIERIPAEVAQLLLCEEYPVIIFGCLHNIWHAPERKEAKYKLGKRLASIVCPPEDIYPGDNHRSYPCVSRIVNELFPVLTHDAAVRVTSAGGSDFQAIIGTPFHEDGSYERPGTGGDFPFGEVGFGPRVGSVNGTIVYDVKVQHIGILRAPLVIEVKEDMVIDIKGMHADELRHLIGLRGPILRYISEISIGLNPFVRVSAQRAYIPEEKTYGTLHCGHGGNLSYGDRSGAHIDGVIATPTVQVDGVTVMLQGRIVPTFLSPDLGSWLESNFDEPVRS